MEADPGWIIAVHLVWPAHLLVLLFVALVLLQVCELVRKDSAFCRQGLSSVVLRIEPKWVWRPRSLALIMVSSLYTETEALPWA